MLPALRRHAAFATLALTIAVAQLPVIAQGRPVASSTPVGQVSIGDGPASPIYGFSFGASNPFSDPFGGGGGTGKVSLADMSFLKQADALSASLLRHVAQGNHLPSVRLEIFGRGSAPSTVFDFADVVVTSYQVTGAEIAESVSMHANRVQLNTGGSSFCWDIPKNAPC